MMPLSGKDADRLPKLLGMLGSDQDGEVVNAARAALSLLRRNAMTFGDLVKGGGGNGYSPYVSKAMIEAAETRGYDRGYRKGSADAWESARKAQAANDARRSEASKDPPKQQDPLKKTWSRLWPPNDDIWAGKDPYVEAPEHTMEVDELNDLWRIETRLTDYEHAFVQSLAEQLIEKGRLTERQCEVLDEIHTRRCVRRGPR